MAGAESCDLVWGPPLALVCLSHHHPQRIAVCLPKCSLWFVLGALPKPQSLWQDFKTGFGFRKSFCLTIYLSHNFQHHIWWFWGFSYAEQTVYDWWTVCKFLRTITCNIITLVRHLQSIKLFTHCCWPSPVTECLGSWGRVFTWLCRKHTTKPLLLRNSTDCKERRDQKQTFCFLGLIFCIICSRNDTRRTQNRLPIHLSSSTKEDMLASLDDIQSWI